MGKKVNPRYQNGNLRRKHRARMKALGLPCHLCGKPIHYDEPSDARHPLSFVVDEIIPISRAEQFGYDSKRQAAEDWGNLAPAHYRCNQIKSNKLPSEMRQRIVPRSAISETLDGEW